MEMPVTGPEQQRSKAELTADIRARRRTALVVNLRSRRTTPRCAGSCTTPGSICSTCARSPTPAASRRPLAATVDSGADLIVVGGGDGTLSEAAHQLAHRDLCLGVLPRGTTNNFARSLGYSPCTCPPHCGS
jgi:NAD kinase